MITDKLTKKQQIGCLEIHLFVEEKRLEQTKAVNNISQDKTDDVLNQMWFVKFIKTSIKALEK